MKTTYEIEINKAATTITAEQFAEIAECFGPFEGASDLPDYVFVAKGTVEPTSLGGEFCERLNATGGKCKVYREDHN